MTSFSLHVTLSTATYSSFVTPVHVGQHQLSMNNQQLCGSQSSSQPPCGPEVGQQELLSLSQPTKVPSNLMPQRYLSPRAPSVVPCSTSALVLHATSNVPGTPGSAENPSPSGLAVALLKHYPVAILEFPK